MSYSGGCQCGEVSYVIESELTDVIYCHCSMCQKLSGSAFIAFGSVQHECITVNGGSSLGIYSATPSAERMFCKQCGSTLFWQELGDYGKKYKCVALGSLDDEFCLQTGNIFLRLAKQVGMRFKTGRLNAA